MVNSEDADEYQTSLVVPSRNRRWICLARMRWNGGLPKRKSPML